MPAPDPNQSGHLLLFNPGRVAGHRLHRDTFCTSSTKGPYLWQPAEFSVLAQLWRGSVQVVDAMAGLDWSSTTACTTPRAIVGLAGGYSAFADMQALKTLADKHPDATILAIGEATLSPELFLATFPWVDAIITAYAGAMEPAREGITLRWRDTAASTALPFGQLQGAATPWKDQQWQSHHRYQMPWQPRRFASLLLRFGCPFSCSYCNSGTLPYQAGTPSDQVALTQLLQTIHHQGVRSLYIRDFSFGPTDRDIIHICNSLAETGLAWTSFIRPERINSVTIKALAASRCRGLQIGIESTDQHTGQHKHRSTRPQDIENAVRLARQHNIPVGGHFVLGIPEDTRAGIEDLVAFGSQLPLAYASWNHYVPRAGTVHFESLRALGQLPHDCFGLDSGLKGLATSFHPTMEQAEIEAVVRRARRNFYLRPAQWLRTGHAMLPALFQPKPH